MKTLIAVFATLALTGHAFAAGPAFSEADTNADGVVSMEEAKAALPEMEEDKLVAADLDRDGALNEAEYTALTAG